MLMAELVNKVIMFSLTIIITRYLGAEGYGQFAFAMGFTSLFFIFADFGISTLAVKEIARNNNIAKNIFKIPVDIKEIGMQYYQEYWHTRYRPADAHPTNLFNDFMYAYSPLGDAELQDFALKIPFDMITKRGLSIKLIENMMPGLSKVEFFSRAGKIKIVNNKIIRIQGSSMYKLLKFIHKLTPRFLISAYRYFKKMYIAKQPVTRNIQREFYVKWLNNDKLLGGLFDFSKQKGSVRRLATCAIYSDLVNSIRYDKKK